MMYQYSFRALDSTNEQHELNLKLVGTQAIWQRYSSKMAETHTYGNIHNCKCVKEPLGGNYNPFACSEIN